MDHEAIVCLNPNVIPSYLKVSVETMIRKLLMIEPEYGRPTNESFGQGFGIAGVIGIVLVILGILVAGWVFLNVYDMFTEPEKLTKFQKLITTNIEGSLSANDSNVKIVIPAELLAYIIPLILLGIASGIAGIFITGGANLAYGGYQRFLMRVSRLEHNVVRSVDSVKDVIKQGSRK